MTIPVETPTVTYLGNGSTTAFNFDFVIPDTSEIVLTITDSSGNQTTPDPSTYSIIPNDPAPGSLWSDGGVVNYPLTGSPLATGNTFTVTRDVPYDQDVTISNQGVFYPQAVEQGLDLLAMQTQQIQNTQKYAIQTPITDVNPPNVLPPAAIRAGGTLGFDGDGQPVIVGGGSTIGTVTSVGLTLPAFITVTGTPVTTTGVIAGTLATQTANTHFAGPTTGSAAAPTFRALVPADLPVATTVALGAVKPDGTTITISGGTISATGSGLGTVTSVGLVLPAFITVSGSPVTGSGTLTGTLATQLTNTFFAGPNGSTGTPTFRTIAAGDLPLATTGAFGAVKPDGTTVTVSAGVISAVTSVSGANPSATAGPTVVNGSATTYMRSDGAPAIQLATASVKGLVQVDGTTITATAGVISAVGGGGPSAANPSATAGPTAVNGSATTFLRSDGAPAIQLGTASQKGILQVDGTTITATSGVISAISTTGAANGTFPYAPLPAASFTNNINGGAGSISVTDLSTVGTILSAGATVNSDILRGFDIAIPVAPYTFSAVVKGVLLPTAAAVGIYLTDGTKVVSLDLNANSGTPLLEITKWTNTTTFSGRYTSFAVGVSSLAYQITDNGSNLLFSISADGIHYSQLFSVSRTDFMAGGPTRMGFFYNGHSTVTSTSGWATLTYWNVV